MSDQSLLLFQLGPVQSFIAQAETIGDLAVGSAILSDITAAAIKSVQDWEGRLVFPSPVGNEALQGIPNRFLMYVPKGEGEAIAKVCEEAAREALTSLATEAYSEWNRKKPDKVNNPVAFLAQVNQFLQTTWAVLENPTGKMGKDYKAIGKLIAMRRNTREFEQWQEEAYGQKKDVLSGKEAALCDGLGAMNLIKRFKAEKEAERFKIPEALLSEKYIAVIAMDGDKMGATLSEFKSEPEHRAFSEQLGDFANSVKEDLPKDESVLIYAGGDDVLAVVKAVDAISVAKKLQNRFNVKVGNTASAGIAIGHMSAPLQDLVHAAHKAESQAKQVYGRDALALAIYKRSGEILEWGCKWDSSALEVYDELSELSNEDNELSNEDKEKKIAIGRFPYKLAALLQPYELEKTSKDKVIDETMQAIVMAEYDHAVEQTKDMRKDGVGRLSRDKVKAYLKECCNPKSEANDAKKLEPKPGNFLNLFMAETFINRPRKGEDE